jgi:hypothetical protein
VQLREPLHEREADPQAPARARRKIALYEQIENPAAVFGCKANALIRNAQDSLASRLTGGNVLARWRELNGIVGKLDAICSI